MGERTLRKRIPPNMSCVIFRPSIISASMRDPTPGWTDTLSAAGGLSVGGGVGLINYIHGSSKSVADIVPVDLVSNSLIISTAL